MKDVCGKILEILILLVVVIFCNIMCIGRTVPVSSTDYLLDCWRKGRKLSNVLRKGLRRIPYCPIHVLTFNVNIMPRRRAPVVLAREGADGQASDRSQAVTD